MYVCVMYVYSMYVFSLCDAFGARDVSHALQDHLVLRGRKAVWGHGGHCWGRYHGAVRRQNNTLEPAVSLNLLKCRPATSIPLEHEGDQAEREERIEKGGKEGERGIEEEIEKERVWHGERSFKFGHYLWSI